MRTSVHFGRHSMSTCSEVLPPLFWWCAFHSVIVRRSLFFSESGKFRHDSPRHHTHACSTASYPNPPGFGLRARLHCLSADSSASNAVCLRQRSTFVRFILTDALWIGSEAQ